MGKGQRKGFYKAAILAGLVLLGIILRLIWD